MRVIATFLLLGVLCHCGLCDDQKSSNAEPTNATASTTQQVTLAPTGVNGGDPTATTLAATTTPTAEMTAATTTTGVNSETANTSGTTAPAGTTPVPEMATTAGRTGSVETTPAIQTTTATQTTIANETATANATTTANATATANETAPATGTTATGVTVTPEATASKQPQPESSTVMSASSASAPTATPSTRTATAETTAALPAVAPAPTANATHNPAGVPPIQQTQSPSSAATTVTVSQDAPGTGGAVTTGNGTGIPPKTTDAPGKGGDGEKTVVYVKGQMDEKGKPDVFRVCEELMKAMQADNCTLTTNPDGTIKSGSVEVNPTVLKELQEKHKQKEEEEPPKNTTLIAILCSCAALLAMTAAFIAYITCHRRSYRKNQQHLTEELQTVENGYHDNPTLEVMEVQPEMQEKKTALNGEFNDSWIVPYDTLARDDMPDEEDTHL